MADTPPPTDVLLAFVRELNATVGAEERLVPVTRGSLLLRHWYGDRARPAADLDLECYERPLTPDEAAEFDRPPGVFGLHGEYTSLVDFGKAMCRYAAWGENYGGYENEDAHLRSEIYFHEAIPPAGETSLYVYGTPGERYFTGWVWRDRGKLGLLQIDISAAGTALGELPQVTLDLLTADGDTVKCPAYAPETLLAAKVSWLMRSFKRSGRLTWAGEPKDLFDAHLLLTAGQPDGELFRRALTAFGRQDRLAWGDLDHLFTPDLADRDFANWPAFVAKYPELELLRTAGPAAMLAEVAARLEPLLADFYPRAEMPFLRAVQADPSPMPRLVYADWLDERGDDRRASFLRRLAAGEAVDLDSVPPGWLHQLFGTSAALDARRGPGR